MNRKQKRKERKICGEFYQFIIEQIIGLIEIDIGNYLYDKINKSLYFNRYINGGLDVYIFDNDYSFIDKYGLINFNDSNIDDIFEIEHLHKEDMLYFILNYKKEKQKMIERVNKYLKFKERGMR